MGISLSSVYNILNDFSKNNPRNINKIEDKKVKSILEMYDDGLSYKDIANNLDISVATVSRYVKKNIKRKRIKLNDEDICLIKQMYYNGMSYKEIAKKMN